jgi:hypothetical protein
MEFSPMPAYVLTKKGRDYWDLPVFYARRSGDEDAIAVFTGRRAAESYLRDAGWDRNHEVSEVTAVELFDLIIGAHQQGVSYVVVNPVRKRQLAGEHQPTIVVEQQIADFAELLTRKVLAKRLEAATAPSEPSPAPHGPN